VNKMGLIRRIFRKIGLFAAIPEATLSVFGLGE